MGNPAINSGNRGPCAGKNISRFFIKRTKNHAICLPFYPALTSTGVKTQNLTVTRTTEHYGKLS